MRSGSRIDARGGAEPFVRGVRLRVFQSYDHMMAAVELFNAISEAAKDLDNFDKLTFGKLVKRYGGKYLKKEAEEKELQQYYKLKIPKEVRIK